MTDDLGVSRDGGPALIAEYISHIRETPVPQCLDHMPGSSNCAARHRSERHLVTKSTTKGRRFFTRNFGAQVYTISTPTAQWAYGIRRRPRDAQGTCYRPGQGTLSTFAEAVEAAFPTSRVDHAYREREGSKRLNCGGEQSEYTLCTLCRFCTSCRTSSASSAPAPGSAAA